MDLGQPPVVPRQIEAIAHHEAIGDHEAHVVEGHLDLPPLDLVEEGADLEAPRMPGLEIAPQVVDGPSAVHDVLDQDHVAALDGYGQVRGEAHRARGAARHLRAPARWTARAPPRARRSPRAR